MGVGVDVRVVVGVGVRRGYALVEAVLDNSLQWSLFMVWFIEPH